MRLPLNACFEAGDRCGSADGAAAAAGYGLPSAR